MRILIIGGGTAGVATATRLRRLDENAEIVIFEQSNEFAVASCGLTYYLSGIVKDKRELIGAGVESMRQTYNIEVRLNQEVTAINRAEKTISIANREDEPYDKLVIAIGAYQLRPDIDGVLSENIFTIKNLASVERIKDYIKYNGVKNVLIIGGGLVGIEAAEALTLLKLNPVLIEASDHIFPAMDADMAALLQNKMKEQGIQLFLNDKVVSFNEKDALLSSGIKLPYDMALIATGVKPDLKLSVLAELEIGESGGLVVNEYMQTSDKDIYAAGDNIEITNLVTRKKERISHAGTALREARIAADHLAGLRNKFKDVLPSAILKLFDIEAGTVGAGETALQKSNIAYHKIHLWGKSSAAYYPNSELMLFKLLFDKDGKILGAQGIGKRGIDKRLDIIAGQMQNNDSINTLQEALAVYAPPFATARDMVNNLAAGALSLLNGDEKLIYPEDVNFDNGEFVFIDVRPQQKFEKDHLPNAINIPLEALRNNLDSIPHDKKVVLYCNHGRKAYLGAKILQNRGFDNIYVLSGGSELYLQIYGKQRIRK